MSPVVWLLDVVAALVAVVVVASPWVHPISAELDSVPKSFGGGVQVGNVAFVTCLAAGILIAFISTTLLIAWCCKPRYQENGYERGAGCWRCAHGSESFLDVILVGAGVAILSMAAALAVTGKGVKTGSLALLISGLAVVILNGMMLIANCCCRPQQGYGSGGYQQYDEGYQQEQYYQ